MCKVYFLVYCSFLIEDYLFAIVQEHLRLIVLLYENDLFLNCRIKAPAQYVPYWDQDVLKVREGVLSP